VPKNLADKDEKLGSTTILDAGPNGGHCCHRLTEFHNSHLIGRHIQDQNAHLSLYGKTLTVLFTEEELEDDDEDEDD
jgi:hypothetical protein